MRRQPLRRALTPFLAASDSSMRRAEWMYVSEMGSRNIPKKRHHTTIPCTAIPILTLLRHRACGLRLVLVHQRRRHIDVPCGEGRSRCRLQHAAVLRLCACCLHLSHAAYVHRHHVVCTVHEDVVSTQLTFRQMCSHASYLLRQLRHLLHTLGVLPLKFHHLVHCNRLSRFGFSWRRRGCDGARYSHVSVSES